jgi:hypothetical protein
MKEGGFFRAISTYLHADTATDAQLLGERSNFRVGSDFNAKFSHANNWTCFLALLPAALGLALVRIDDGNARLLVGLISLTISRHPEIL